MDAKDLSKLPRALQLAQMGRRKRVSRQDHDQRRTALENLTNRVLQTPRKVAKMDKKNSQEEKLQSACCSSISFLKSS